MRKELSDTLLSDSNSNTVIITTRQKLEAALRYAQRQEEQKEPTVLKTTGATYCLCRG